MTATELKQPQASSRKIDARQAAKLALKYLSDLFPETQSPRAEVALEEVEFSEDENYWLITLGFNSEAKSARPALMTAANLFGPAMARKYKVFKVDARTGKVVSMRIRKLE